MYYTQVPFSIAPSYRTSYRTLRVRVLAAPLCLPLRETEQSPARIYVLPNTSLYSLSCTSMMI